jgi:hypothetical protein
MSVVELGLRSTEKPEGVVENTTLFLKAPFVQVGAKLMNDTSGPR